MVIWAAKQGPMANPCQGFSSTFRRSHTTSTLVTARTIKLPKVVNSETLQLYRGFQPVNWSHIPSRSSRISGGPQIGTLSSTSNRESSREQTDPRSNSPSEGPEEYI